MIKVKIVYGNAARLEKLNEQKEREYFDELQSNGANQHLEKITFEQWTRPLNFIWNNKNLEKFNQIDENSHFIFGYLESFAQSDRVPQDMVDYDGEIKVIVSS